MARAERAADAGDVAAAGVEARIAARDADQRKAKDEADRLALDVDRRREIVTRMTEAKKQLGLGDRSADEARICAATCEGREAGRPTTRAAARLRRIVREEANATPSSRCSPTSTSASSACSSTSRSSGARVFAGRQWATRASYLDPWIRR
jgi:hypothetical protein